MSGSIWQRAATFAVLSCDIFDTLIHRVLARPEDVFLAVGLRGETAGLITVSAADFAVHRQTAERVTRAAAEAAGFDEVRIAEIYDFLAALGIVTSAERMARLEFETECDVCRPIAAVQQELARIDPARVVFASDTILPGKWLAELLDRCGYGGGLRVFCSADLRLSKHTGRLFPAMAAALGVPPAEIMHIGDNDVSDVIRAKAAGFACEHLPAPRARAEDDPAPHPIVRLADSLARTRALTDDGDAADDGRWLGGMAAPLVIGFSLFVLQEARRRGITRLYFLARDGYLPMAIVARLLDLRGERADYSLIYLHLSRASATEQARNYLAASGFLDPGPRLVVDLGWRGSIQTALTEFLPLGDLSGCYLGLWQAALRDGFGPREASGYVCAFGAPVHRTAILREGYIVPELIFSAPHGTVLSHTQGVGAAPVHATETGDAGETRRAAFAALEDTILDTFDTLTRLIGRIWPEAIDADSALAPLRDLLTAPSTAAVARVNRIPFIHDATGEVLLSAVNPLPWHEALRGPRRALRRLDNAPWRAGAIRAALPPFIPFMPWDVLKYRVERILRAR